MKKVIVILWSLYLFANTFAFDDYSLVEERINNIKEDIATTECLPQNDINYLLNFFDEVKMELER